MKAHFDGPNYIHLIADGEDEQKRMSAIAEGYNLRISAAQSVYPTGFHGFWIEFKRQDEQPQAYDVSELRRENYELRREIEIDNILLAERNKLLAMIPPCPIHGSECIPWAKKWIHDMLARDLGSEAEK